MGYFSKKFRYSMLHISQRLRAAGKAPGALISFLSLGLALYSMLHLSIRQYLESTVSPVTATALTVAGGLFITLISIWIGSVVALRTLDPETFAEVMVAGRPAREVLHVIANKVIITCSMFETATSQIHDFSKGLLTQIAKWDEKKEFGFGNKVIETEWKSTFESGKGIPCRRWLVSRHILIPSFLNKRKTPAAVIRHLKYLEITLHKRLQRLESMKRFAAADLAIPPRRFCDRIVQYSAAMHRARQRKFLRNWEEMSAKWDSLVTSNDFARFRALLEENCKIFLDAKKRIEWQIDLIESHDLHEYIHEFASTHSTSGSLQTYSRALEYLAKWSRAKLSKWTGKLPSDSYLQCEKRFMFLFRKVRAHPGFDLHRLLDRICEEIQTSGHSSGREASRQLFVLQRIAQGVEEERERNYSGSMETRLFFDPAEVREARERKDKVDFNLYSLECLPLYVSRTIASSRERINRLCGALLKAWRDSLQAPGTMYIVTHGYSKTVRDVIKMGLPDNVSDISVFLLIPERADETHIFDARLMQYELKAASRGFKNVSSGDLNSLQGLLDKEDVILFLLGAECFDESRRVLHPRGMSGLRDLRKLLGPPITPLDRQNDSVPEGARWEYLVTVVAEHYKLSEEPLTTTKLYAPHFDRVEVYEPKYINLIVSNRKLFPDRMSLTDSIIGSLEAVLKDPASG